MDRTNNLNAFHFGALHTFVHIHYIFLKLLLLFCMDRSQDFRNRHAEIQMSTRLNGILLTTVCSSTNCSYNFNITK